MFIIMNKPAYWLRILFFLLIAIPECFAQINDAGLWTSVTLEKKLNRKITLGISEEFRFNENISELSTFFTEAAVEYEFTKAIAISGGYRFINKRRVDDSYSKRHRFLANLVLKWKFGEFNTSVRLRYQSQFSDIESSNDGSVPKNYLRTKLSVKYDLDKRYTPFISGETYYHTNNSDGILFDNFRLSAGIEYDFSKKSSAELGYIFDREVNINEPWTNYIIALSWKYRL